MIGRASIAALAVVLAVPLSATAGERPTALPVAREAPMVIVPSLLREAPPRPSAASSRAASGHTIVKWVVVPMPRLRPRPTETETATAPVEVPAFDATDITASITPVPVAAPSPVGAAPPPTVRVVMPGAPPVVSGSAAVNPGGAQKAPPPPTDPAEYLGSDDLVGDPTVFMSPPPGDMIPDLVEPSSIDRLRKTTTGEGAAPAPPRNPQSLRPPYELVRTLQLLQDQMAAGSTDALAAQRLLRAEIDRQFTAADPKVWQDHRNAEAAVTYVLSGGTPAVLARLARLHPPPAIDPQIVAGVLAYVSGDESTAAKALSGLSLSDLPPSMSAQVALAQSALAVRSDPQMAMHLLSMARLLAPGTLVEEAAIRRQIYVADQLKATDDVASLARQYLDRFRHSVYAGNFRARFAAAISHMDFVDSEAEFPRLDDMVAMVEPEARCQLYLTVALASVVKGRVTGGRLAAARAMALAAAGTTSEARARLYHAAALVADATAFDAATSDLGSVDRSLLTASDQALYDMVGTTLQGVGSGTKIAAIPLQQVASLDSGDTEAGKPTPIMIKAQAALKAADAALAASAR